MSSLLSLALVATLAADNPPPPKHVEQWIIRRLVIFVVVILFRNLRRSRHGLDINYGGLNTPGNLDWKNVSPL